MPPQRLEPMYGGMPPYREPGEGPHCQSGNRRQEKVRLGMAWNRVWAVPGPGGLVRSTIIHTIAKFTAHKPGSAVCALYFEIV